VELSAAATELAVKPVAPELTARRALEHELEALHRQSFGWALACCRWNRAEAADVLQAAYLKVLDGHARFDRRSSAKTWLFAVIRRTAAESRRRQWLRELLPARWLAWHPQEETAPDPESLAVVSEAGRTLRAALGALSGRQRDMLHLVFYQDLTIEEAARVLAISVGSARTHYERGKARLRELLPQEKA
jgi:RNA polymerase sigma-70 factor (ECF subfamily)